MQLTENLDQTYCAVGFANFSNIVQMFFDIGIYAAETVRSKRKQMLQTKNHKQMKRGDVDFKYSENVLCCKWYNNKSVLLLLKVIVKELFQRAGLLKESVPVKLSQQVHLIIFENIRFLDKDVWIVKWIIITLKLLWDVKFAVCIYVLRRKEIVSLITTKMCKCLKYLKEYEAVFITLVFISIIAFWLFMKLTVDYI